MLKGIIIEDEVNGIQNLKNLLATHCPQISIVAEAGSIVDSKKIFSHASIDPDVVFMDINLSDGTVFELLEWLSEKDNLSFDIIFITAETTHLNKAFDYSSIGYIVKPIDSSELKNAVSRIEKKPNRTINKRLEFFHKQRNNPNPLEKISIPSLEGYDFVDIKSIIRFEGDDNYSHIYIRGSDNKIVSSRTVKYYQELLDGVNFFRVHKSHLINMSCIKRFVKGDGGFVIMDDGTNIEVSRRRRAAFIERMSQIQQGF